MASHQFVLSWKDHNGTLASVFENLLRKNTFVDCTLAADGQYLKAHKMVLSACSSYFELLFSQESEKNPIIILKDVEFQDLEAAVNFMYRGEVEISEDRLAAFLEVAESLQIKGLRCGGRTLKSREKFSTVSEKISSPNSSVTPQQQSRKVALNSSSDSAGPRPNIPADSELVGNKKNSAVHQSFQSKSSGSSPTLALSGVCSQSVQDSRHDKDSFENGPSSLIALPQISSVKRTVNDICEEGMSEEAEMDFRDDFMKSELNVESESDDHSASEQDFDLPEDSSGENEHEQSVMNPVIQGEPVTDTFGEEKSEEVDMDVVDRLIKIEDQEDCNEHDEETMSDEHSTNQRLIDLTSEDLSTEGAASEYAKEAQSRNQSSSKETMDKLKQSHLDKHRAVSCLNPRVSDDISEYYGLNVTNTCSNKRACSSQVETRTKKARAELKDLENLQELLPGLPMAVTKPSKVKSSGPRTPHPSPKIRSKPSATKVPHPVTSTPASTNPFTPEPSFPQQTLKEYSEDEIKTKDQEIENLIGQLNAKKAQLIKKQDVILGEIRGLAQRVVNIEDSVNRMSSKCSSSVRTAVTNSPGCGIVVPQVTIDGDLVHLGENIHVSLSAWNTMCSTDNITHWANALVLGHFKEKARNYGLNPKRKDKKKFSESFKRVAICNLFYFYHFSNFFCSYVLRLLTSKQSVIVNFLFSIYFTKNFKTNLFVFPAHYFSFLKRCGKNPPYSKKTINEILRYLSDRCHDSAGRRNTGMGRPKSKNQGGSENQNIEFSFDPDRGIVIGADKRPLTVRSLTRTNDNIENAYLLQCEVEKSHLTLYENENEIKDDVIEEDEHTDDNC